MEELKVGDICVYTGAGISNVSGVVENGDTVLVAVADIAEGKVSVQYTERFYTYVPVSDLYKVSEESGTASKPMTKELAEELGLQYRKDRSYPDSSELFDIYVDSITTSDGKVFSVPGYSHQMDSDKSVKNVIRTLLKSAYKEGLKDAKEEQRHKPTPESDLEKAAQAFLEEASKMWHKKHMPMMGCFGGLFG